MNKEYISIIIPSFNEERYIGRCIQSITNCNYQEDRCEIILVDNASTDNTVEIAKNFGIKIFIDAKKNIGGLRNIGYHAAKGDILGFLDADCTVDPEWLNKANATMRNMKIGVTGSRLKAPSDGGWIESAWATHLLSKSGQDGEIRYINSGNCFVRRKAFDSVGGFSESLETNEDEDLCERIRKEGYSVFHNGKISATHWGYPKTIGQFFRREVWHGTGDVRRNINNFWKNKPILLSLYNILIFCILLSSVTFKSSLVIIGAIAAFFLPSMCLAFIISIKRKDFRYFKELIVIYCIYGLARTTAFLSFTGSQFKKTLFL